MMSPTPPLAVRYLELNRDISGADRTIHADDEMFRFIAAQSTPETAALKYFRSGFQAFRSVEHVLQTCNRPLSSVSRFLDFACGWGRVTRFFCNALGPHRVWASDIEASAIAFVGRQFRTNTFQSSRSAHLLAATGQFDVVYVGSLFSHLSRDRFEDWISSLWSLVAHEGILLFTTHGARAHPEHARNASGFIYLQKSEAEGRLDTRDYGTTYVDESTVRQIAHARGLPELGWLEAELWGKQDLWVAQRGRGTAPRVSPAPTPIGSIEKAWFPTPGHAWVGGGVRLPTHEGTPRIRLWIDGVDTTTCLVSQPYPYPHPGAISPGRQFFHWYTEGPLDPAGRTLRDVAVGTESSNGLVTIFDVQNLA